MPESIITSEQVLAFEDTGSLTGPERLIHQTLLHLSNAHQNWSAAGFDALVGNLAYVVEYFDPADVKSYFAKVQQSRQNPGRS